MNLTAVGLIKACPVWLHQVCKADPDKPNLNTTTLLRAATIVRNRRHISDRVDSNSESCQCTNRRLTTRPWTLDLHIEILDPLLNGRAAGDL